MLDFVRWPKIARLHKEWEFTEKVDGTNGVLWWTEFIDGDDYSKVCARVVVDGEPLYLLAGSRTRWLTPSDDNFGFAAWAVEHAESLVSLGRGRHFGEWFGKGIQRGYDMDGREFALFDQRFAKVEAEDGLPEGVCVVPVIGHCEGQVLNRAVEIALEALAGDGSVIAPKYPRPEGIVVRHTQNGSNFKVLLEGDNVPKGLHHVDSSA